MLYRNKKLTSSFKEMGVHDFNRNQYGGWDEHGFYVATIYSGFNWPWLGQAKTLIRNNQADRFEVGDLIYAIKVEGTGLGKKGTVSSEPSPHVWSIEHMAPPNLRAGRKYWVLDLEVRGQRPKH